MRDCGGGRAIEGGGTMKEHSRRTRRSAAAVHRIAAAAVAVSALAGCGGAGNPLDNPDSIANPSGSTGNKLSFAYFQRCVFPIFLAQLPINQNGAISINTCAASGCHDNSNGTGGAFRLIPAAQPVDLANPANTPDVIRATDIYKNFYSAQGEVVFGSTTLSRLLAKPMLINVLHGGGLIFDNAQDQNVKLIQYWINNPAQGQDEFSSDPSPGACNMQ
jgi:hypothetical protein